MLKIIVKTQADLDALPAKFELYTVIEIHGGERNNRIAVTENRENSSVEAWENSSVEARGNSSVVAWGNSSVVALGNSSVEAWGNSSVVAWENSSVVALGNSSVVAWENSSVAARGNSSVVSRGNSSVVAWENSSVEAWENSSVEARENSSVEVRGNSSVVAWENSSVVARENSSVVAYGFAMIAVLAESVIINHLADYAVASLRGVKPKIEKRDKTATIVETPERLELSFKTWLDRGYVNADGILQKLVSRKRLKDIEIFTVRNFPKKEESFVVKRGDVFSHGETVEKAIDGLRYKLSDRDTFKFKAWKPSTKITAEEAIQAYRAITGACEFGVRQFCESTKVPENLTVSKVIELTNGKYGSQQFAEFFK